MKSDKRLKDKEWRIEHLYKIKNKSANLITFKKNPVQRDFNKNKWCKNIILKSRQLGFTTFEGVDMFDDVLFNKNLDTLFIAQDLDTAIDIFNNKINLLWDNFRLKDYYNVSSEQARKIKLGFGDGTFSSILVDSSGRSGTYRRVHITELAWVCKKYPAKAKEIIEGTIPAIPSGGRVDIESTAEDEFGIFHDMFWEAWNRGQPTREVEFKAHFYNWTWDFEEMKKIGTSEKDLPKDFKDYQKKMNLTDLQITYYYYKWLGLNKDWRSLRKEYPTTPEEAFASAGDKLFDVDKVALLEKREGNKVGDWIYYEEFNSKHIYGIGADVAEGIGRDSSTAVIWDYTVELGKKPKVVAEYCSNKIAPDMFAYELRNGGNKYGTCMIAVERNNHGHATLSKLKEIYPSKCIYTEIIFNKMLDMTTEKLGWHTNLATKPDMLYELSTAINEELVEIPSKFIIFECRTYPKEDLHTIKAKDENTTQHWDRLMACAIGWKVRTRAFPAEGAVLTDDKRSEVKRGVKIKDGFVSEEEMNWADGERGKDDWRYI